MRIKGRIFAGRGGAGILMMLVASMVVTLLGPGLALPAAAQDDLGIQTRVQILHASPDLGQIEVHINYEEVVDEFEYGQLSDWISFEPGAARVTITADRAGFNYAVFDAVYPAPAGNDYYLVITDTLVLAGVFDTSPIPDRGARVRITQGSVALPAVNVTASGVDVDFATELTYPRSSDYAVVPAGTYDFEVTLADTGDVAVTAPGIVLDSNMTYEMFLIGSPSDTEHPLEIRVLSNTTREEGDAGTPAP